MSSRASAARLGIRLTILAERPRKRWRILIEKAATPQLTEEARARVIAGPARQWRRHRELRASEALANFIESCAPGEDPNDNPAFRPPKWRYSMRKRGQMGVMGMG